LYNKYFIEKRTAEEIADICDAGKTTIKRWIKKHGFQARDGSECQIESLKRVREEGLPARSGWCRTKWYTNIRSFDNKEIIFEGTWELCTALFFESVSIKYLVHGEFDPIVYKLPDGTIHRYVPDFYLPEKNLYVEIKGRYLDSAKIKMTLVLKQNNVNLEIWRRKDLISKGIILSSHSRTVKSGYYNKYLINSD